MADESQAQVVVLNATIYPWQRSALMRRQRELGVVSLSEALRFVLGEALERPASDDGAVAPAAEQVEAGR